MDNWYYTMFGQEFGPVSRDELNDLLKSGTLSPSDQARQANATSTQDVQAVVGQADTVADIDKNAAVATMEDFEIEGADPVSIDDFVIERTSDDSATGPKPKPELVEDTFYLRSNQMTIGPLSQTDLCRMADAGKISADDEIRRSSEDEWHVAAEVPEVMASTLVAARPVSDNRAPKQDARTDSRRDADKSPSRRRNGPSSRSSGSHRRPDGPRRKRREPLGRKRKPKVDQKLQGIFDEVFSDQADTSRSGAGTEADQSATPTQTNQPTLTEMPAVQQAPGLTETPAAPAPSAAPVPTSASTLAGVGAPMSQPASPPVKAWTPPPKKKKSRSGFSGFDSSHLKVGGIVLGVVGLLAMSPMLLSAFSFGSSIPDASGVETELSEFASRYQASSASKEQWVEYGREVRTRAGDLVKAYRANAGSRSPRDIQLQQAATAMIQLVNSRFEDKEKQESFLATAEEHVAAQ